MKFNEKYNDSGATGAVGQEIISCLEKRKYLPIQNLRLLASTRSKGMSLKFRGENVNNVNIDAAI